MSLEKIKKNKEACDIILVWLYKEIKELKNPDRWKDFEEGKAKFEAAKILNKLAKQLTTNNEEPKKRTSYV